jgi:dTDP-glucose pyrophosphorylase
VTDTAAGKTWRKALLPSTATIQEAIRCLDASSLQIALVVSSGGTLVGTITDGDVRRGLLRGVDLSKTIDAIVFREALVVPPQLPLDMVLTLMQANEINALPIVDDARRVVGLHVLRELLAPVKRTCLFVVMAGGVGTRLMPHTENCPKPLLPVGGKPMLEHIIERAKGEGFSRFVLAVRYLGHMIEEYFGDGRRWQVDISYVREGAPLGTAGALSLLDPRPVEPVVVTNADVMTDIRYAELLGFHMRNETAATMAVRLHEWQHPFGVVRTQGIEIVGIDEKPVLRSHVNAGIYVLEPSALDAVVTDEPCDMTTLFLRLRERGLRTIVYPMHEPWLDVGRAHDLERAQARGAFESRP